MLGAAAEGMRWGMGYFTVLFDCVKFSNDLQKVGALLGCQLSEFLQQFVSFLRGGAVVKEFLRCDLEILTNVDEAGEG